MFKIAHRAGIGTEALRGQHGRPVDRIEEARPPESVSARRHPQVQTAGSAPVLMSKSRSSVSQIEKQQSILASAYGDFGREVRFMTGPAVCRTFARGPLSPPDFDAGQREYDKACDFARQLLNRLPSTPPANLSALRLDERPHITDDVLRDSFAGLDREAESYLRAKEALDQTVSASDRTSLDETLAVFSPLLLAVALALRITKVTGEIRLQRRPAPPRS